MRATPPLLSLKPVVASRNYGCFLRLLSNLFTDFDFTQESKDAKQRVEQEQTQMNMEMTPLLQDDGDVIREEAQMTSENLHDVNFFQFISFYPLKYARLHNI